MNEHTDVPTSDMGVATPMPDAWFCAMWVPVFCAILWGMMVLFGQRPGVDYGGPPDPRG